MTFDEAMSQLEAAGSEKNRQLTMRRGAPENQFGVQMGDIRKLATRIKTDHELGLKLWESGNLDAMYLATFVMKPSSLSTEEMAKMVRSITYSHLADWFNSNVVKSHPAREQIREPWMSSPDPMEVRAGWSLTTERVNRNPEGLDIPGLLDRIEAEMGAAHEDSAWTMNYCLASIGINFPEYRERALGIGEKIGLYRERKVSKGCVSPYAPIWITEMVSRKAKAGAAT